MRKEKKTEVRVLSEHSPANAFIVQGNPKLTFALWQELEKQGCQTIISDSLDLREGDYNYFFVLEAFNNWQILFQKLKSKQTKVVILLDIGKDKQVEEKAYPLIAPFIKKGFNVRALKLDGVLENDISFLVKKILKITFEKGTAGKIFSFASIGKSINKKDIKISKPSPLKQKKGQKVFVYSWTRLFLFFLALVSLFLFLTYPLFSFAFNIYHGTKNLKSGQNFFEKGEIIKANDFSKKAFENFDSSKRQAKILKRILTFLPNKAHGENLEKSADLGKRFSLILQQASLVGKLSTDFARGVLSSENQLFNSRIDQIKKELELIDQELAFAEVDLAELENWRVPAGKSINFDKSVSKLKEKILIYRQYIDLGRKILAILPSLVSTEGKKDYLVLFKNNMELRPGGGFIGSFAFLSFDQGRLTRLKVEDVYSADGNLKGHVDPPGPIRKFLEQPHWYLRDSNWQPDFAQNAIQAEWFLEKEIGKKVDGVFAIDLAFAQNLLKAIGGVTLSDYKEIITADNLFLKAQTYTQKDFFPGSTQKKDFLGSLASEILNYLTSNQNLPYFTLLSALKKSLEEKHLMFYFHDDFTQKLVEELGWGGRVSEVVCLEKEPNCMVDYLMFVEANLGVNKANYFVKKRVEKQTEFLEKGGTKEKVIIVFENKSPRNVFPAGPYKNYLRILVPKKASFEELQIVDEKIALRDIDSYEEEDKKIFGFLIEIPPQSQKQVIFSYSLEKDLIEDKKNVYQFIIQKQAGTGEDPFFLKLNFPKKWQVKNLNFPTKIEQGRLEYLGDLSIDRVFLVEFEKKD